MAFDDLILAPESLEKLLGGLTELGPALGPAAEAGLTGIRAWLEDAVAAKRAGDRERAVRAITVAMRGIAQLADSLDPREAAVMRAVATQFDSALQRGDAGEATRSVDLMRERSGARRKRDDAKA